MSDDVDSVKDLVLKPREHEILKTLLDPSVEIEVLLPTTIDGETLWRNLSICCQAMTKMKRMAERLRPIIGRMLLLVQNNPEFYKAQGFNTFEDFIARGVVKKLGLSRTDAYEAKRMAQRWPTLSAEDYSQIGSVKMTLLSRSLQESATSNHQEWLDKAKDLSVRELRTELVKADLISNGECQGAVIVINTTQEIKDAWEAFIETAEIQSVCQSGDPGCILGKMMAECSTWVAEWNEAKTTNQETVPQLR